MFRPDIGNLHVIDYCLHRAAKSKTGKSEFIITMPLMAFKTEADLDFDFDITTEQREGWAYGNHR